MGIKIVSGFGNYLEKFRSSRERGIEQSKFSQTFKEDLKSTSQGTRTYKLANETIYSNLGQVDQFIKLKQDKLLQDLSLKRNDK